MSYTFETLEPILHTGQRYVLTYNLLDKGERTETVTYVRPVSSYLVFNDDNYTPIVLRPYEIIHVEAKP